MNMNMASLHETTAARLLVGMILACAWVLFAALHVRAYLASGTLEYLVFFLSESFTALMFLLRATPSSVSSHPGDWALAVAGTAAPLMFAPSAVVLLHGAAVLVFAGAVFQLIGLLSLNRSIGLVPARRELKTGGSFRLVRHPLYASYLLMFSGYLLTNFSAANLLVYCALLALLLARIGREEHHLSREADYRAYMERVKYRVIPYVF
jgi:protein-S-isoprenylcysteine O-methyltransferase Ste14